MHVPVDSSAGFKGGVVSREKPCADEWREKKYGVVCYEGDEHFMDVEGESVEIEFLGPRGDQLLERAVGREEGVVHNGEEERKLALRLSG